MAKNVATRRSRLPRRRRIAHRIEVGVITTSFPLHDTAVSGPFIMEMARNLPTNCHATIVTPCGVEPTSTPATPAYRVRCFRYAPWTWQILTHGPGGLPAALRESKGSRFLLLLFLPAFFMAALRAAVASDILHANWSATGVIAGLAGRLTGTPCITTLRGSDVALGERSRFFRAVLRVCAHLSGRIVAVGDGLRERTAWLLSWDASRIALIPNGIDGRFFDIPAPEPHRRLRFLTVGSLVPVKGLDTLLEALGLLDTSLDWELTLVGGGPERSRLEMLAREQGIGARVRFTGALPPAAIPAVLAEHDVFLLTSRSEGRPNALLEAMAAARAVVASDIPAVLELVADGENGLLFAVDDARSLTCKIQQLLANPATIPALGQRARESVATMTWVDTGQKYEALYRQVLEKTR